MVLIVAGDSAMAEEPKRREVKIRDRLLTRRVPLEPGTMLRRSLQHRDAGAGLDELDVGIIHSRPSSPIQDAHM